MTEWNRKYEREEFHEMFRRIVNLVKPEHPYGEDYPVKPDELRTTWIQSRSNTWARCGPRGGTFKAFLAIDVDLFNRKTVEEVLVILVHEATHIEEGSHTPGSGHNPRFWEAMQRNVKKIIEEKNIVEEIVEPFETNKYIEHAIHDANSNLVDKRMETVDERKEKMRNAFRGD